MRFPKMLTAFCTTIVAICVVIPSPVQAQQAIHKPFAEPMTAADIRVAIDDAVLFLRDQIGENGQVVDDSYNGGATALTALALLAAGGNPIADDQLDQMLEYLAQVEYDNTYFHGVRANVWEYALRKAPHETKYRDRLKADYDWLMKATKGKRAWRYTQSSSDWDNSCTQYGVLGVWAAQRAGFEPGPAFWEKISKHFLECQAEDGGWGYTTGGSSPNMATAGLASLFLVYDSHQGRTAWTGDEKEADIAAAVKLNAAIEKGMKWLAASTGNKTDGYYLYGMERTGVASGRRLIGGEDWFRDGAMTVLKGQQSNGSIPLSAWGRGSVSTAFCTLFLVYGGAPVAMQKLQYGDDDNWNRNSRDLANLSKELWSLYEKPVNWQVVSIDADVSEFDAPILFISGSEPIDLNEEQMVKLRNYLLAGGTIFAEPSNHSTPFMASMKKLFREMFPETEYPDFAIEPLAADHPIYTVISQNWQSRPKLLGAGNGSRTFFVLSQEYASADWQLNLTEADSFKLASNLLFYATDLGELRGRFSSILPDKTAVPANEKTLNVAIARFGEATSHPRDWETAVSTWRMMSPLVTHTTGATLTELPAVRLKEQDLAEADLLHLAGSQKMVLSDEERQALQAFVKRGGMMIVDGDSEAFANSSRDVLEELFGKLKPLPADHPFTSGRFTGGADLTAGVRFTLPARQKLRAASRDSNKNQLLAFFIDGQPAVIYSEFSIAAPASDIRNYRAAAYKPESARKILGNIAAWLLLD